MAFDIEKWSDVNWAVVNKNVDSLRKRILRAKVNKDFRNLRSLQRLMLKSKSNILLSIQKVASNKGGKTFGIDSESISGSKEKFKMFSDLCKNGYLNKEPKPTRRVYIQETNKLRPIGIPTIHDRIVQSIILNSLEPEWEAVFEFGSYGFRPKRSVDDAISRLRMAFKSEGCRKWIVDTDIQKCFDSISHSYIISKLEFFPAKALIGKYLKSGISIEGIWMEGGDEGTPQGASLSPLLCNIALHGLEAELGVIYDKRNYVKSSGRLLIRFADDLVILCHTRQDAINALEALRIALIPRGLQVSEVKTKVVHLLDGFDFLGYNIILRPKGHISKLSCISQTNEDNPRLKWNLMGVYISPSKKSVKKIKSKLKEVFDKYNFNMTKIVIKKANAIIRGYAQSKWHWNSSRVFSHLNEYVYKITMSWIKRRHPRKSVGWLVNNYFTNLKQWKIDETWVFHAKHNIPSRDNFGDTFLYKFHWFNIRPHVLAEIRRLPDRKEDKPYYEKLRVDRLTMRPFNAFFKLDRDLAESQFGICPVCEKDLYNGEFLNIHHIIPRAEKGKFIFSNLVLVHYLCHQSIHIDKDVLERSKIMLSNYRESRPRIKKEDLYYKFT